MLNEKEQAELAALEAKSATTFVSSVSGQAQAAAAIKLMEANNGTVTTAQLAAINPKYPSDPIYYARKLMGLQVATIRARGGKTTYKLILSLSETKRLAELKAKAAAQPAQQPAQQPAAK